MPRVTIAEAGVRIHRRAEYNLYVNKIIGDEPHLTRARDISESGVYLQRLLEPELDESGHVGLELMLPDTERIVWALGQIVRKDSGDRSEGVAIRFVRIAEEDRQAIREYVTEDFAEAA